MASEALRALAHRAALETIPARASVGLPGVGRDPGRRRWRVRHCARWPADTGSGRPEPLEPMTQEPRVPWPTHRNPRISKKLRDTEPQVPLEPVKVTMSDRTRPMRGV